MSTTYRPPFDEDDERDLRALYRRPGPGANPELDAAVRRNWHAGHSWHPGWGAAACIAMVFGLFAWTNMREMQQDPPDQQTQLISPRDSTAKTDRPVFVPAATAEPQAPAAVQRTAATQDNAAPAQEAPPTEPQAATQAEAAPAQAEPEVAPFSEQDIEARIAHIRSLMQADQTDDAVQALRELQHGAQDLALPDDLQELAEHNPA